MKRMLATAGCMCVLAAGGDGAPQQPGPSGGSRPANVSGERKVVRTDAEWRKRLTTQQYKVLRQKGTDEAFTGALWNNHQEGTYECAGCGQDLFSSSAKFDSGTGWPSFFKPIRKDCVEVRADHGDGMERTEVLCSRCDGHLGHVFDDGPRPTGLRYCTNSSSLRFVATANTAGASGE